MRIGEDDTSLIVIKRPIPETPQLDWALCFGDAVHSARVALDALAWALAQQNGVPVAAGNISFPISNSEVHFEKHCSTFLPSVSPEIVERMRHVQPFNAEDQETSWLRLLTKFDNWDKHRGTIFTQAIHDQVSFQVGQIRFADEEVTGDWNVKLEYPIDRIGVGDPLARFDLGAKVKYLDPEAYADIRLGAAVNLGPIVEDAFKVSLGIAEWVGEIVRYVALGTLPPAGELVLGPAFGPS